jgi:hypothetical protein
LHNNKFHQPKKNTPSGVIKGSSFGPKIRRKKKLSLNLHKSKTKISKEHSAVSWSEFHKTGQWKKKQRTVKPIMEKSQTRCETRNAKVGSYQKLKRNILKADKQLIFISLQVACESSKKCHFIWVYFPCNSLNQLKFMRITNWSAHVCSFFVCLENHQIVLPRQVERKNKFNSSNKRR